MPRQALHRWLIAETQAWPLVGPAAFELAITTLERQAPGAPIGATRQLATQLDRWLRPRASGWSLEALRALRQQYWFARGCGQQVSLTTYASDLADRYLEWTGTRVTLHRHMPAAHPLDSDPSATEQVSRWHWLCRSLPGDLLIAALGCRAGVEPMGDAVDIVPSELGRVLEREVAETHLHVGAAVTFPALWTDLVAAADR
ncbi:MAG: hypothetical protein AAGC55_28380, partial [Myxococcota bacterium]